MMMGCMKPSLLRTMMLLMDNSKDMCFGVSTLKTVESLSHMVWASSLSWIPRSCTLVPLKMVRKMDNKESLNHIQQKIANSFSIQVSTVFFTGQP